MNYSKIVLGGRFVDDPKPFTAGESNGVNFTLAVNSYVGGKGSDNNRVDYFDCVAWGKRADAISNHCTKGTTVLVDGQPRIEKYEDKDGNPRSRFKVSVNDFSFVGGSGNKSNSANSSEETSQAGQTVPF
jgi:single-strand DNA-binding protein